MWQFNSFRGDLPHCDCHCQLAHCECFKCNAWSTCATKSNRCSKSVRQHKCSNLAKRILSLHCQTIFEYSYYEWVFAMGKHILIFALWVAKGMLASWGVSIDHDNEKWTLFSLSNYKRRGHALNILPAATCRLSRAVQAQTINSEAAIWIPFRPRAAAYQLVGVAGGMFEMDVFSSKLQIWWQRDNWASGRRDVQTKK